MSGSRLGRGRGGRLAVYGGCGVVIVLLVLLYRAATSEMARLRELHVQCAHQQEALAAQLQVIFEYKVRLEKSLAEEKSSNVAVKQELQQRASREKSLRDKDSLEATQRFNSLQQSFKLLQTEHQDLQDECNKRQKQALEDTNRLENTLQELRSQIRQAKEDKEHSLEHLKTKYLELEDEKTKLEDKYNALVKNSGDINSTIEHCRKEVFQLNRELQEAKKEGSDKGSPQFPDQARSSQLGKPGDPMEQSLRSSQQQQVSRPSNDDANPQPMQAPRNHHAIGDFLNEKADDAFPNEQISDVGFAGINGVIVPIGPNEVKAAREEQQAALPLPYDFQEKHHENFGKGNNDNNNADRDFAKPVLPVPNSNNESEAKMLESKSSSQNPKNLVPILKPQKVENSAQVGNEGNIPRP